MGPESLNPVHVKVGENLSGAEARVQFPVPAGPADVEIQAWEQVGAGDFGVTMEMEFAVQLDLALFRRAVDLLLVAEPMLVARLRVEAEVAQWEPMDGESPQVLFITEDTDEYERLRYRSPVATRGPQIAIYLYRGDSGDRVHVKVTHQLVDGTAQLALVARLAEIYSRLAEDPSYLPQTNLATVRDFSQVTRNLPRLAYLGIVWDLCKFAFAFGFPRATHGLGLPEGQHLPWVYLIRDIPRERMTSLATYGRARGATLNDIFLAAFYRTLLSRRQWDGKSGLRILVTVDLRQWYIPAGQSDAICNLSAFELPFLGRHPGANFESTLERVKEVMGARKRNRPGLATALVAWPRPRHQGLPPSRLERTRVGWEQPGVPMLTNGGRIDGQRLSFGGHSPVHARHLALSVRLPHLLISISGFNGAMTMSCAAPEAAREEIESILDMILANLPV